MKIPLPNLDDRRWVDLVDEGRSLIPLYAPDWTDHNVHDPGITLMELLAWIAEMDIYQLNRISDAHKRKFLALIGITLRPPQAAQTVLSFSLKAGAAPVEFPSGTQVSGGDPFGEPTSFSLLDPITVVPGKLQAIQIKTATEFYDASEHWRRRELFGLLGKVPETGAELYLGFAEPFPPDQPVSLYFKFAGSLWSEDERRRVADELKARKEACRPPHTGIVCGPQADAPHEEQVREPEARVRTEWEYLVDVGGQEEWIALDRSRDQVTDSTYAFTFDGAVVIKTARPMVASRLGQVEDSLYYLRCRFAAGAYDAPPIVRAVIFNAAKAEQAIPVQQRFLIARGAVVSGDQLIPGQTATLRLGVNERGEIVELLCDRNAQDEPAFMVLSYEKNSSGTPLSLTIEGCVLGSGDGTPYQKLRLPSALVQQPGFSLFSLEANQTLSDSSWRSWDVQEDFGFSNRTDAHFLLDSTAGEVSFGDGEKGRVPGPGSLFFAVYRSTRAADGNLAAYTAMQLLDSAHNQVSVPHFNVAKQSTEQIINALEAGGGLAAETLTDAAGRAIQLLNEPQRAVTLKDYEYLALKTPGAKLGRATARANLHPGLPCLKAAGVITVIILPNMAVAKPVPSRGLRRVVAAYLNPRRVIGTRVEVVGPTYLDVTVRAEVKAVSNVSRTAVRQRIVEALNDFFNPLTGGPEKNGWPFGRDVYRSEVMQVIDEVLGVDHVLELQLIAEGCEPECGNICLAPTWLVAAGDHVIEVI
ncbi:MAG TPA: putative baseplate assembly protein [Pyrinomonadaceae bacterium]|nr:putative baseplate assembly protein [Pyrinomonadaceae bacterium]